MGIWFLENANRLLHERKEIEQLQLTKDWLLGMEWCISGNELAVQVKIEAHGHIYELEMGYPPLFPFSAPGVKSIEKEKWWTEHQYVNGTLCLEWGPDNWHENVTGARILESAYRLIYTENPKGKQGGEESSVVLSRHVLSVGQELRTETIRLYVNQVLLEIVSNSNPTEYKQMNFHYIFENRATIVHIGQIYDKSKIIWENDYLPNELKGKLLGKGSIYYVKNASAEIKSLSSSEALKYLLLKNGYKEECIEFEDLTNSLFILVDEVGAIFSLLCIKNKEKIHKIPIVMDKENVDRRQPELFSLKDKKVGMVGVGSLGSKIVNALARSGVEKFFLVDEDIFLRGNIQRHTLDWRNVGNHKVDAIKEQLELISSSVEVEVSRINLTGQEAITSLNANITELGSCDVIVDATADSKIFNLLSAICKNYEKPMIWGELFSGGIGGLIARSRPKLDPSPQIMRKALLEATSEMPTISQLGEEAYGLQTELGEVWIASDADVGIIANHLARYITDALKDEKSDYPFSMYLIGLKKSWIFEQPFEIFPIETNHLIEEIIPEENQDVIKEVIDFIAPLLEKRND
ncbi:TPA: ThiF family adenylyltransferase [Bacillus cereus]|uniref:ThiF family adenylyltransferase n=1 Tax=Bacillus TaxID=1386 RepID=UPI0005DFD626|nr:MULTISPECIES: ThiF family adenylyltransferase [Bacillus]MDV8108117.1 ThiF family adenylyltransferase [Bacillus sp. BAU-SS-2023]CJC86148.1 HesA/MoeB/ThiF family protein [Streptococcus pneumoniae]MCT4486317.1 ThiF family adenylyltransferase [Bacillus sp. DN_7.5]MCT6907161.1 ThiF family adenylyltransferase [Bacillus cereus]MCX2462568.1 ThiF family adenylyltransferase [Bacillus sp. AM01]